MMDFFFRIKIHFFAMLVAFQQGMDSLRQAGSLFCHLF